MNEHATDVETIAPDSASDHVHPFWCKAVRDQDILDGRQAAPHNEHEGHEIYVELQDYDALATFSLTQLDDRHEGGAPSDLRIRVELRSRALMDSADAYMTLTEAKAFRAALDHRIGNAESALKADREHSRGWALGTGSR